MKISACMIVKNEEEMLGNALLSLLDVDELIVCDTGSTDRTVYIAKQFTDKVYTDFVWCDDFSAARNHAASKATGDWILVLDADEQLATGSLDIIRGALEHTENALNCRVRAVNENHAFYNIRAYRNCPEIFYEKPIHNHLNVKADFSCEAEIIFGYSPAHREDPDRAFRILTKYVCENPKCSREKYYLAREYFYRRMYPIAAWILCDYVSTSTHLSERADAYLMLSKCYWYTGEGDKAREACMNAILINANFKEAVQFMATLHWEHNSKTWVEFAEHCTNENVLFDRTERRNDATQTQQGIPSSGGRHANYLEHTGEI